MKTLLISIVASVAIIVTLMMTLPIQVQVIGAGLLFSANTILAMRVNWNGR